MALQQTITLTGGIDVTSAYHKVSQMVINVDGGDCQIKIDVYKDQTSSENGVEPVITKNYWAQSDNFTKYLTATAIDPLNINHVSQAYEYLKTLPDYQGAIDV